jgi:guanylate kinase
MPGKLFLITAPSGVGKSTLVAQLLARCPLKGQLYRPCTYTTRPMSAQEKQGVDYHFVTEEEFLRKLEEGFFIEWSTYYGYYYGSPRSILQELASGCHALLIVDRQGARAIKGIFPGAIVIGIGVSCQDQIIARLTERAREEGEKIAFRIARGLEEQSQEADFPLYDHYILNDDFSSAYAHLEHIIIEAVTGNEAGKEEEIL